jgi:hypothetical protein
MGSQWLTAWATARPKFVHLLEHLSMQSIRKGKTPRIVDLDIRGKLVINLMLWAFYYPRKGTGLFPAPWLYFVMKRKFFPLLETDARLSSL